MFKGSKMSKNQLTIGLLSHWFQEPNLGCIALSICNVMLIDKVAQRMGITIDYRIMVNEKQSQTELPFTNNKYEHRIFMSCKKALRHPFKAIFTPIFKDCDIFFNLCAGDGFTDIYGFGRVFAETYLTFMAYKNKKYVVLAPQTIGPFNKQKSRPIAKSAMRICGKIFTRDSQSTDLCKQWGFAEKTIETIDVAFFLPYTKITFDKNNMHIGINVSGLLYQGGYNKKNYFSLSFDYQEFIHFLVERLLKDKYSIHLITHVSDESGSIEDDYTACLSVAKRYPDVIVAPRYDCPMEVKGYIAGMDFFSGARMHATIAAFSAGTPVIPIAYSRKFNGLYDTLNYPFYIDAKGNHSVESAINYFMHLLENKSNLITALNEGQVIYKQRLNLYQDELCNLLHECISQQNNN
jgi:polysaccharide pyruvyl transferase WcaK-like protein